MVLVDRDAVEPELVRVLEFVQVPRLPVSVWPSCAVPLIVGLAVFAGGFLAGAAADWTGPKAAETARVVPPVFLASTWNRMV